MDGILTEKPQEGPQKEEKGALKASKRGYLEK